MRARRLVSTAALATGLAVALVQPVAAAPAAQNVCKIVPGSLVKAAAGGKKTKTARPSSHSVKPTATSACQWAYLGGTITAAIIRYAGGDPAQAIEGLCTGRPAVTNVGDRACFVLHVTPGVKQATLYARAGNAIVASTANVLGRHQYIASRAQLAAIAKALVSHV
jgi:hypothetical protein